VIGFEPPPESQLEFLSSHMGYEIHIERTPPFTLDEWKAAVRASHGVRLEDSRAVAINPTTQEVISILGKDGDAQVNVGGRWQPCFRWRGGSVAFRASEDFSQEESELRKTVRQLAGKLTASVRGDEGECYD
jgi:hypothetical protein